MYHYSYIMKKLRLKVVKGLTLGHTAGKQKSQVLKLHNFILKSTLITNTQIKPFIQIY